MSFAELKPSLNTSSFSLVTVLEWRWWTCSKQGLLCICTCRICLWGWQDLTRCTWTLLCSSPQPQNWAGRDVGVSSPEPGDCLHILLLILYMPLPTVKLHIQDLGLNQNWASGEVEPEPPNLPWFKYLGDSCYESDNKSLCFPFLTRPLLLPHVSSNEWVQLPVQRIIFVAEHAWWKRRPLLSISISSLSIEIKLHE